MTDVDKWAKARQDSIASVKQCIGRTITGVSATDTLMSITFDDGSSLEVGCYVEQRRMSDIAELSYEVTKPENSA